MFLLILFSRKIFSASTITTSGTTVQINKSVFQNESPVNMDVQFSDRDLAVKNQRMDKTPVFDYLIKENLYPTTIVSVFSNPMLAMKTQGGLPYSLGALTTKLMKDNMINHNSESDADSFVLQKGAFVKAWTNANMGKGDGKKDEKKSESAVQSVSVSTISQAAEEDDDDVLEVGGEGGIMKR